MRAARRPWLGFALLAAGACTFPSVSFHADGGLPRDAAAPDSPSLPDAADVSTADSPDPCDKDGDHFLAEGSPCNGNDCDDNDPRAYPGEPKFLTDTPTMTTMGDWDCDGHVDYEYPTGFMCPLTGCTKTGFSDASLGCGQYGNYVTCMPASTGLTCQTYAQSQQPQGCR